MLRDWTDYTEQYNNSFIFVILAMRVVAGIQAMIFHKVLKLQAGGEELSGQISNIINNDMERIMEAIIGVVFLPGKHGEILAFAQLFQLFIESESILALSIGYISINAICWRNVRC